MRIAHLFRVVVGLGRSSLVHQIEVASGPFMASPFSLQPLQKPGFFHRIFRIRLRTNALVELTNALANAVDVQQLTLDTLSEINVTYKTDIHRKFRPELANLYREFLSFHLSERKMSKRELDEVWHLKKLFGINDAEHEKIYQEAAVERYERTLSEVLKDGSVSAAEKAHLERLSAYLKIPEEVRQKAVLEVAGPVLKEKWNKAVAEKQLSPHDEEEIHALCRSLGIKLDISEITPGVVAKLRLMWQIKNAELPVLQVPIELHGGEVCHFSVRADYCENRTVYTRVTSSGPRFRTKILKGIYWDTRLYDVKRRPVEALTKLDSGVLYLTNRRLIFTGGAKNLNVKLTSILDIHPYSDGVGIDKDSGRRAVFAFTKNLDVFGAMIARCIHDLNEQ
jgi:hypothetical protein